MSYSIGQTLHGFTVDRVREAEELNGRLIEMHHDKTGAQLAWLDNGADNKLFCAAFKTLPEDSTGVFHILEHSVLCGSDKYPVREHFVELMKGSMNTFLNAMTFSDKTIYPMSSRNEQDFMNLAEVYLDAVFAPAILHNRNIFLQEGWHIETAEDGTPSYKGVVFNEMKGAMSDVNELIYQKMLAMLFPDNCYGFNSGGDPTVIPQLTYEQFLNMYRRYYHPSNARIYLDGAVPMERTLPLIDSYLCRFERLEESHDIPAQAAHASEATQVYALGAEEEEKDRGYFTMGKIVGSFEQKTRIMAIDLLMEVLMGNNEAPLKQALLSSGLCQDVSCMLDNSIAQPWLCLIFSNVKDGAEAELRRIERDTVSALVEKGVDKAALMAAINVAEFHAKVPQEPAALNRCIENLKTWLYGGDPMTYLLNDSDFASLRAMVEEGGFNELLRELLQDETDMAILRTLPSKTYEAELKADEAARLNQTAAAWTEADRENLRVQNEALTLWQQTPDTAQQLATLPMLDLKDIPETCHFVQTEEKVLGGATVLTHQIPSGGAARMTLSFSLTDCTLEELSLVSVMTHLWGELPTENYTAAELDLAKKTWLGNFYIYVDAVGRGADRCVPRLCVACDVLEANVPKANELIVEIITRTDFSDRARISNILLQQQERVRQMNIGRGNILAMAEATAGLTAAGAANEAVGGVSYGKTLKALCENLGDELTLLANRMQKETMCQARLVLSAVSDHMDAVEKLVSLLPEGTKVPDAASYVSPIPARTSYAIPAQIGYAALSADYRQFGADYTGTARVLANILSLSYLWNEIRVQGGAYGCGLNILRGSMSAYSFRDPTPARSLEVYRRMAQALRDFTQGEEKLDKYIISTVAESEPPLGASAQKRMAENTWWNELTPEDLQRERAEILHTDEEALLGWCPVLDAMAEKGHVCVVAHEGAIAACAEEHLTAL